MLLQWTWAVPKSEIAIALLCFFALVVLLAAWLRSGFGQRLVAVPNERSSHIKLTPTGGGVVIVLVFQGVLLGYYLQGVQFSGWLGLCGGLIALLGLVDDVRELSARLRLALQVLLVGVLLWSADAVAQSQTGWLANWPALGVALLFGTALVWFINLFNFMDGIDGLAAAQSGSYCLAALFLLMGDAGWYAGLLWAGVACSLGFAVFNAPPARIFMGDAGSAFWGLLLATLSLQLAIAGALPLVSSLVLLSAFWFDASYTLIVRILTGQRFTQGHRSHLYQRLADRYGHGRTTLGYLALFLFWQWPLAAWIRSILLSKTELVIGYGLSLELWWIVALSCLPLLMGCIWWRAGAR